MRSTFVFYIKFIIIVIICIILDQTTKNYLIYYLKTIPGYMLSINPMFDIVFAWNYGISFGMFSSYYQYSNYILLSINSIIIIFLWQYFINKRIIAGSLIMGGALGNVIDRIYHGAVFDFISLHYMDYYFAIFNLADLFINIGALLLILSFFSAKYKH